MCVYGISDFSLVSDSRSLHLTEETMQGNKSHIPAKLQLSFRHPKNIQNTTTIY